MGLEITQLTKRFGAREAVSSVSRLRERRRVRRPAGPLGCGKSTLLRMIAGIEMPDEGAIRLGDREITHLEARDRDIAMVFQSYALYPHMTIAENIGYPLKVRKRHPYEIARRGGESRDAAGPLDALEELSTPPLRRRAPTRRARPSHHPSAEGVPDG